jgi:streptogramin lyase
VKPFLSLGVCNAHVSLLALGASLLFATLTGCSGLGPIPDTVVPTAASQAGGFQGSVFGGHAPIVGAHVYVLQAGTSGYASTPTSELTTGDGTDTIGTYVLTNALGAFNITGDYSCTSGHPVYLAAVGGSSSANPTYTITAATFSQTGNSGKYSVTFTANNSLAANQSITFYGLSNGFGQLNGTTQTVTAVTPTTFTIQFTGTKNSLSGSTAGYAVYGVSTAITNLATLGICPGTTTEFAATIKYVFMNEVSTVATAFAFSGFGTGPLNIGAPTTNLIGIQNAAVNAGQLYDIQGSNLSTTNDGEGHIARSVTPAGNGIVPQTTIDTIANILSSCVDASGPAASQCATLFQYATSTGTPAGTQPTDTATAAFNIAQFPGGSNANNAAFMNYLFALQSSGVVPFTPKLATQPNDFSIAIVYPAASNPHMGNPESIAIDGSGDVFFTNQSTGYIIKLLPTGALSFNYNSNQTPGYLSIDPTGSPPTPTLPTTPTNTSSNNIWFGAIGDGTPINELTNTGTLKNHTASNYGTVSAATIDSNGDFYFVSAAPQFDVYELTSTMGNATHSPFSASNTCIPSGDTYDHLAVDASQQVWASDEHGGVLCRFTTTGAAAPNFPVSLGAGSYPEAIGIDSNSAAWVSEEDGNQVDQVTIHNGNNKVTVNTLTSGTTGASFNQPFSATIDGLGNVWVTNRGSSSIAELTNGGAAVSPTTNYQFGSGNLSDPLNAAIDGSGDIWITNYNGQEVVELVGAAAPVVTPLSYASGSGGLGSRP